LRIDAHNHLGGPDKGDGKSQTPEELLASMDGLGIEKAVVFPFNEEAPGISFSHCNDYIAAAVKAHPDRLIGFCRLDPNFGEKAVMELERSARMLGLVGVKLHPTSQNFTLENPWLSEILAVAGEMGMTVVFDTGKMMSPPSGIARLAREYPNLKIIMAHINLLDESIAAAKAAPNIYLGTTGYFNLDKLAQAVREVGAHRFISGSDSPYIKMEKEVDKIREIPGISPGEVQKISGGNFAHIMSRI
jgi:hypothetical protein